MMAIKHGRIGPVIWNWSMNNWQFYAGWNCGDYGKCVVWIGPLYVAI